MEILFTLTNLRFVQHIQQRGHSKKGWGVRCLAGETIAVMDANGDFRHCELRDPITNLRKHKLNFSKMINSKASKKEAEKISCANCWKWCTHICFIYYSVYGYSKSYFVTMPKILTQTFYELVKYLNRKQKNGN